MMRLIDTHAHIYTEDFTHDLTTILKQAKQHHVDRIYMPNIDEHTIAPMLSLADNYPDACFPMMGIHPCHVTKSYPKQLTTVETWLNQRSFAAIGEIGIDLYHSQSTIALQKEAFILQLRLAKQYQLPVSIHCRHGFKTILPMLEKEQDGSLQGVIHCFSTTAEEAKHYIELGLYLGIGGILTMQADGLIQALKKIPLSHLVLETDSPYLAPAPYRGKRNEPAYVYYVAKKLADVYQVTLEAVAEATTQNAEVLFGKVKSPDTSHQAPTSHS